MQVVKTVLIAAPIDGRIEVENVKLNAWTSPKKILASVESPELAALMEKEDTAPKGVFLKRSSEMFHEENLHCSSDCVVIAVLARPKSFVKAGEIVFEVATALELQGKIKTQTWADQGHAPDMELEIWSKSDPDRRWRTPIEKITDGAISARLAVGMDLGPETAWEGRLQRVRSGPEGE